MNQFNPFPLREDKGEVAENYAFLRLREKAGLDSLHFWRTADGQEIDFIITEKQELGSAIEIKYDSVYFNPGKVRKFIHAYPGFTLECRSLVADSNKELLMTL